LVGSFAENTCKKTRKTGTRQRSIGGGVGVEEGTGVFSVSPHQPSLLTVPILIALSLHSGAVKAAFYVGK